MNKEYHQGFDDGFECAIKEFLYFIEQYELTEDNAEFKMTCARISEDIRKYFVNYPIGEIKVSNEDKDGLEGTTQ